MKNSIKILILFVIIVVIAMIFFQNNKCDKEGGIFVRTLMWYECIGKIK